MIDEEGFILELAYALGFQSDDDLENYSCTTEQLLEFVRRIRVVTARMSDGPERKALAEQELTLV